MIPSRGALPLLPLALLPLLTTACGEDQRTLTIEVIPGHETDAFHREPAVTRMEVAVVAPEGDVLTTAAAPPGGDLDFGELPADVPLTFDITGLDATGARVVRGRSVGGIVLGQLVGDLLPLFAQRLGTWSRPPGDLPSTRQGGVAFSVGTRFLALTGGAFEAESPAGTLGYDLLAWFGDRGITLPRAARSVVARGDAALLIDDVGASWFDFAGDRTVTTGLPAGLGSFADVAAGRAIDAGDGRTFVVGGTRAAPESAAVLVVEADGSLRAAALSSPRAGAAAVWVEGVGLVIAGGSATAPGVEVLTGDGAVGIPRPFPEDATVGAGAVIGGLGDVVLMGGVLPDGSGAPTRRLSPSCATDCTVDEVEGATLGAVVTGVAGFVLPGGRSIAVGNEAGSGATRSFVVDLGGGAATEILLREPRRGATVVAAPNGTLAMMGGVLADGGAARTIEILFPE